jgi:deoxyribose-phosphate aldolase
MTDFDDPHAAQIALGCLDLTSLKDDDTPESIAALARRAATPHGPPAALCVYPRFVGIARRALDAQGLGQVRVATVVDFPRGDGTPQQVAHETAAAIASGADEIDVVFPWRALRDGDPRAGAETLARCREAAGRAPLKVILETGELREAHWIRAASETAIAAGADFLKTSTGKVAVNATPEAATVMLEAIVAHGARVGLKVAGGVATLADVRRDLALAAAAYGAARLAPDTLRFGASSLLPVLLAALDGRPAQAAERGY